MKRIIPFAPHYTIDEHGRVFGPTGVQLDYEVRQNRFGDVLTVAIGEGNEMTWHSVIELVSAVHFNGDRIVCPDGSKLVGPSPFDSKVATPSRFVSIEGAWNSFADTDPSAVLPRQDVVTEIWWWYRQKGATVPEVSNALATLKNPVAYRVCRDVIAACLISGIRE